MATAVNCLDCQGSIMCSVPKGKLVVTPCFHTYCIGCLKEWVTSLEKTCPICRKNICKVRSGKDFVIIWNIFVKIFEKNPEMVWEILRAKEDSTDECANCLEDFPSLSVGFDVQNKTMNHAGCQSPMETELTVRDVVRIVRLYAAQDPELAKKLEYQPPTMVEKMGDWVSKIKFPF